METLVIKENWKPSVKQFLNVKQMKGLSVTLAVMGAIIGFVVGVITFLSGNMPILKGLLTVVGYSLAIGIVLPVSIVFSYYLCMIPFMLLFVTLPLLIRPKVYEFKKEDDSLLIQKNGKTILKTTEDNMVGYSFKKISQFFFDGNPLGDILEIRYKSEAKETVKEIRLVNFFDEDRIKLHQWMSDLSSL